jgi:putative ABC transport system permease protein
MAWTRSFALWLDTVRHEVRYGLRGLRRTPLATGVMVASVALGIGVATAVFTLTDVMLLRPLPYPGAERLVVPYQTVAVPSRAAQDTIPWSFAQYDVLGRVVKGFEEVGFAAWVDAIIRTPDADVPVRVEAVTRSLLSTFSLRAESGRLFGEDEDAATAAATVGLISDHLWRTMYGGDGSVIGTTILINGTPVTVVGIMPQGFSGFTVSADVWLPVRMTARIDPSPRWTERLGALVGTVIARATPGSTLPRLERQLVAALPVVYQTAPDKTLGIHDRRGVGVMSLQEARRHPLVTPILQLMGVAVVCLLLIVCANVASILLARGHMRRGELGVRMALGASKARVGRQVLTESALLGALALPAGLLLGYTSASTIAGLRPTLPQNWVLLRGTDLLAGASLTPNVRVLAFALTVAGLTTLVFGSGPAVVASRIDAARLLTSTDDHATPPARGRQFLVAAQIALASLLLVIAGLMTQSLRGLLSTDLGFQADGVLALRVASMDTTAAARVRRGELIARLEQTPGIDAVAMAGCTPFDIACVFTLGARSLDDADASARAPDVEFHAVSASYFRVMRIRIMDGRGFIPEDTTASTQRVILSASAARTLFGTRPTIGRQIVLDGRGPRPMEVVGVVHDVRFTSVEAASSPAIYVLAGEDANAPRLNTMLFVRTTLAPEAALQAIGRAVRANATPLSIATAERVVDIVRAATSSTRFVATLLLGFAASAALLAGLGIYGVVSYIVSQRSREFGVRLVLGADGRDLVLATVRRGVWLVGGGVGVGLVAASLGARLLGSFLYGIGTFDLATDLAVVALVTVLGLVATFVPARRITRIDPAAILKV